MRSFLERILAHYPDVARRCCEVAASWVAREASTLSEGQVLWRSEDDILPGLAQAVRENGVDLAEMARKCGFDLIELRRKLALSRFGELLKPGEIWRLTDHALEFKLQQAAREYSLELEELLDEISRPFTRTPSARATFTVRSKAARIAWPLRCWICRNLRPLCYRIDFAPHLVDEIRLLREPVYACDRCLPMHLIDQQAQQIARLGEGEIPNSSGVRIRSAAFAVVVILVFFSWYIRGSAGSREPRMPKESTIAAPVESTPGIAAVREDTPVRAEPSQDDPPAALPVATQVGSVPTPLAPIVISGSRAFTIVTGKRDEIAATTVLTPPEVGPADGSQRLRDQAARKASNRATALNNCREVLHNERPLMRYSIREAAQDAGHKRVSVAVACATTATSLTQLGNECAGLYNWFEAFQTKLTRHMDRICREAVEKGTTP